jgi:hypothetical protein
LTNVNEMETELGSVPAQPEPVQAFAPTVTTGAWVEVLTVWEPVQGVPTEAPEQVKVRSEAAMEGPLAGVNSLAAATVRVLVPVEVVRTLYRRATAPVKLAKVPPEWTKVMAG